MSERVKIHLFKTYYYSSDNFGQTLYNKVERYYNDKLKRYIEEKFTLISHPNKEFIYTSAINHYLKEFAEDNEVKEFKELVNELTKLKNEINEMLLTNKGRK